MYLQKNKSKYNENKVLGKNNQRGVKEIKKA